jgi:SAM-dependent methyltransferase
MTDSLRDRLRQAYDNGAEARNRQNPPQWKVFERAGCLSQFRINGLTRLLEVGAGTGRDSRFFADEGCVVTCIDLSREMVRLCRAKGLNAHVMDVADMSFADESFDAVYSFNSLLHLPKNEIPSVLLEIRRVLAPGGLFYFGTWGGFEHEGIHEEDDHDPHRFFSFHDDEQLTRLTGQAFDVLDFRSIAGHARDSRFRFQSLLLRKPRHCPPTV